MFSDLRKELTNMLNTILGARLSWHFANGWVFEPAIEMGTASTGTSANRSPFKNGMIRNYIGKARLSWVDVEDVAAVAAACLLNPEAYNAQTHRLGYEAATYDDIAAIFTRVLGQPFSYEARPSKEFYENVLAAGAEPSYMKCVYDSYTGYAAGKISNSDEVFANFPAITGGKPRTLANFVEKHANKFRY
jgi:NAD(P)H dehydrogenase (quinone)